MRRKWLNELQVREDTRKLLYRSYKKHAVKRGNSLLPSIIISAFFLETPPIHLIGDFNAVKRIMEQDRNRGFLALEQAKGKSYNHHRPKSAVFLHGILGTKRNFRSPVKSFINRYPEWKCIAYDHRGHGMLQYKPIISIKFVFYSLYSPLMLCLPSLNPTPCPTQLYATLRR